MTHFLSSKYQFNPNIDKIKLLFICKNKLICINFYKPNFILVYPFILIDIFNPLTTIIKDLRLIIFEAPNKDFILAKKPILWHSLLKRILQAKNIISIYSHLHYLLSEFDHY